MNYKLIVLLPLVLLILCSPLVLGAPPFSGVQESSTDNLHIAYPKFSYFPDDTMFELHFHVMNTTGLLLDNSTVSCEFHLYNSSGNHIIKNPYMDFSSSGVDFEQKVSASLAQTGVYTYIINCNTSLIGGFLSTEFEITPSGKDEENKDTTAGITIMMFVMLIGVGIILLGFFKTFSMRYEFANLVINRSCYVIGVFLLSLNATIIATIAAEAGLPLTKELLRYMWILGWTGYSLAAYLVIRSMIDALNMYRYWKKEKRTGDGFG